MPVPRAVAALLAASLLAALSPAPIAAQGLTGAALEGLIRDSTGRPVIGGRAVVTLTSTGERWRPVVQPSGRFVLEHVSAGGPYEIAVTAIGYGPVRVDGIVLATGQRYVASVVMARSAVQVAELKVSATAERRLEPGRTGPANVLDAEQVALTPNVLRNFTYFTAMGSQVFMREIDGWSGDLATFQVDGGQGTDLYSGNFPGSPIFTAPLPFDAISEMSILSAPYDVRHGQITSGVFSFSSLRATNRWTSSTSGFFQNEQLVASAPSATVLPFTSWSTSTVVTGPIIRDRLHLAFVADVGEFRRADRGPFVTDTAGGADLAKTGVSNASAVRFKRILAQRYGLDAGTLGPSVSVRPRVDLWGKLSLQLGAGGVVDLTQRAASGTESGAIGIPTTGLRPLPPAPYRTGSTTRNEVRDIFETRANWRVQPFGRWSNELVASWRQLRDRCYAAGAFPRITVTGVDRGSIIAGADTLCLTTDIRQTSAEIANHTSVLIGAHLLTGGVGAEWYGVEDPGLVGSQGAWTFANLDSLDVGRPSRYTRTLPGPMAPQGPITAFHVVSFAIYLQDRLSIGDRLQLTVGLRADRLELPDAGRTNPMVMDSLGLNTGGTPAPRIGISPRLSFSWDVTGRGSTWLRGGAGVFRGRPPYRWLSGLYRGSGGEQLLLACGGSAAPPFDPTNQPTSCAGVTPTVAQLNVYAPALEFPAIRQYSIGVDQRLPLDFTLSADLVVGEATSEFRYTDANLKASIGSAAGEGGRPMYGTIAPPSGLATPSRIRPTLNAVILVDNGKGATTTTASFSVQRRLIGWWAFEAGYRYVRSRDHQSLASFDPLLNFGSTPLDGTLDSRSLGISQFATPHKVFAQATVRLPFRGTFTLLYIGDSALPYSYVVDGDANADGVGNGSAGSNDLVYVPGNALETGSIRLVDSLGATAPMADYTFLASLIASEPCLRDRTGSLSARNGCSNGWTTVFNVRLTFDIPVTGRHRFELGVDIFNLPNLLDPSWGSSLLTTNAPTRSLLKLVGWNVAEGRGVYRLNRLPGPTINEPLSRYRIQFSARYRF